MKGDIPEVKLLELESKMRSVPVEAEIMPKARHKEDTVKDKLLLQHTHEADHQCKQETDENI